MMEQRQIVRLWQRGGASVLVTLVRVEGSSYRRPGARLLLGAKGEYAGTISGGCLEAEVIRKAGWMVREGARVERYSTMFDDTAEVPFGLGCGGVVDLLLESAETPECKALMEAMEGALAGRASRVVTWLPGEGKALRRVVLAADGAVVFASEGLARSASQRVSGSAWCGGDCFIFDCRLLGERVCGGAVGAAAVVCAGGGG